MERVTNNSMKGTQPGRFERKLEKFMSLWVEVQPIKSGAQPGPFEIMLNKIMNLFMANPPLMLNAEFQLIHKNLTDLSSAPSSGSDNYVKVATKIGNLAKEYGISTEYILSMVVPFGELCTSLLYEDSNYYKLTSALNSQSASKSSEQDQTKQDTEIAEIADLMKTAANTHSKLSDESTPIDSLKESLFIQLNTIVMKINQLAKESSQTVNSILSKIKIPPRLVPLLNTALKKPANFPK